MSMRLHIEVNTDHCKVADALRINDIITTAIDNIMDTASVEFGVTPKKRIRVGETLNVIFSME